MFGRYTFSKAPFAGQGSNAYALSLTENASLGDAPTIAVTFPFIITEPTTLNDTNAQQDIFYFGNVDAVFHSDDVENATANYPASFSDGVTCDSTIGITAQFAGTITEALASLASAEIGSAYFDTHIENFTSLDSPTINVSTTTSISEGFSVAETESIIAHFAVSSSEVVALTEHLEAHGWIQIIDISTPNWTPVQDAQ